MRVREKYLLLHTTPKIDSLTKLESVACNGICKNRYTQQKNTQRHRPGSVASHDTSPSPILKIPKFCACAHMSVSLCMVVQYKNFNL